MSQETNSAPVTENKMGTMPIGRLVFNMSLPMMISMLVQALYNIVDSIFVAKLSEKRTHGSFTCLPFADTHHRCRNRYRCRCKRVAVKVTRRP